MDKNMSEKKRIKFDIGKIYLSNNIIVSDPCYHSDLWCTKRLTISGGEYNCYMTIKDCGAWGKRIANVVIKKVGYSNVSPKKLVGCVGVDSGQCGIYDLDYFISKDNDKDWNNVNSWYRGVCDETLAGDFYWDDKCIVTSSGYGDGGYDVYVGKNDFDEIVVVKIDYNV